VRSVNNGVFGSDYDTTTSYGPDTEVYITMVTLGDEPSGQEIVSLYSRLNPVGGSTNSGYELQVNAGSPSNWIAFQQNSGTFNELGVLGGTTGSRLTQLLSAGDAVGMKVTGTGATVTVEAWYKASGGSWTSLGTWTDSSATRKTGAGKLGLEFKVNTTFATGDDFGGGTVSNNTAPAAPTLNLPANNATGVSTKPQFQLRSTDPENDDLQYEIQVCSTSDCSSVVRTICQNAALPNSCSASQTGWSGQDKQSSAAYTGNSVISSSTMATHTYQAAQLSANTQYWWRAYAIDNLGSNTASSVSTINTFTTNNAPATPTLVFPSASATGIASSPILMLRTTDAESDYLDYFIQLYSATACGGSQVGSDIDQTSSQIGWQGQNQNSALAYYGSSSIGTSTIARYQYSGTALTPNHLYSWRAKAIDPSTNASNTYSSLTSCQDFTTGSSDVNVQGGTTIQGGSTIQ
jgi:hypothetical protein